MADLSFASDFPQATRDQWLALVAGVLKGAPFDKALVSHTADGLRIEPLYPKAEAAPVIGRAASGPWQVLTRIDHPAAEAANAQALLDLENGATGLHVVFAGSAGAHGFGLADGSAETVATLLRSVMLDAGIRIEMDLSMACKGAAEALADQAEAARLDPAALDVAFGYDPLGQMALCGGGPLDWPALAPMFGGLARTVVDRGFRGSVCSADGRIVHAAGGSEAQELAFAVSSALAYWRAMEAAGIDAETGRQSIGFRLAADADQFLTIAKIRAARVLWARIGEAAGLPASLRTVPIHGETSRTMLTRYDTWVNALRSTVACFAAGIGGADAVTVLPHDLLVADGGTPLGRRLARNTQSILQMESHLAQVADAAGGSWYVEALTQDLAAAAWALLGDTERAGGIVAAVEAGGIHDALGKARVRRSAQVATRRRPLTGLSEFPDIDETPPAPLAPRDACGAAFAPLIPHRLSEGFEEQRGRADARARDGQRPVAFLATLGTPAEFTPRATYAKNLFEAGGIRTVAGPVEDFPASGAAIACLCSADAVYRESAAEAATRLRDLGAVRVYLAGRGLDVPGVDEEIGLGCDVLDVLTRALDTVGVPR